jgi:hypothetical protein
MNWIGVPRIPVALAVVLSICFYVKGQAPASSGTNAQGGDLNQHADYRTSGGLAGGGQLNVNDFGADGTGAQDSTLAIQRAIDAAASTTGEVSGDIYVPPGHYKVCGLKLTKGNLHIHGSAGAGSNRDNNSTLQSTSDCATYLLGAGAPNLRTIEIDHLSFRGSAGSPVGLYLDTVIAWNIHDNHFQGFPAGGTAMRGGSALYLTIERNGFSNTGRGLDLQNDFASISTYYGCNVCWIKGNTFSDGLGERMSGIVHFYDNDVESGPSIAPPGSGFDYWGAVEFSDRFTGTFDADDNYFELSMGRTAVQTATDQVIPAGIQTVTPKSMANIITGALLSIDGGEQQEFVKVTAVSQTGFTAEFHNSHDAIPVSIFSPMVGFNINAPACAMCRIAHNTMHGEGMSKAGSTGILLAHRSREGYTYSIEIEGNTLARWETGIRIAPPANQSGIAQWIGENHFVVNEVRNPVLGPVQTSPRALANTAEVVEFAETAGGRVSLTLNTQSGYLPLGGQPVYLSGLKAAPWLNDRYVTTLASSKSGKQTIIEFRDPERHGIVAPEPETGKATTPSIRPASQMIDTGQAITYSGQALNLGTVTQEADRSIDLTRGNIFTLSFNAPTTVSGFYPPGPTAGDFFVLMSENENATLAASAFHLCLGKDYTMHPNLPMMFVVGQDRVVREVGTASCSALSGARQNRVQELH